MAINAIEIGRHLAEAKEICFNSGQTWESWVENECDITKRQSDSYIKVYNRFGNVINEKLTSQWGIQKLNLLAQLPDDTNVEKFVSDNDIENKSVRELARIIKETKGVDEIERKMIEEKVLQDFGSALLAIPRSAAAVFHVFLIFIN